MSHHHGPAPDFAELERRCAAVGLKLTEPRRLILQVLADSPDHPSVENGL